MPNTEGSITVNLPEWVSPFSTERPRSYRTTPKPIFIGTYKPWTSRASRPLTMKSTMKSFVTQSLYKPWDPVSFPTTAASRPLTTQTTTPKSTTQQTTTMTERTLRVQPGTILMMDSEYLKEKYITTGLTTTFHRALLADYFGLSEREMIKMGMTVVAWGFSYQVKDKATKSRGRNRAPKYFCDFKFRSSTFNAGYVGAKINMGIVELDG